MSVLVKCMCCVIGAALVLGSVAIASSPRHVDPASIAGAAWVPVCQGFPCTGNELQTCPQGIHPVTQLPLNCSGAGLWVCNGYDTDNGCYLTSGQVCTGQALCNVGHSDCF